MCWSEVNLLLGFKRAPHHNHYHQKLERENFNRIPTILYLFAIINKISKAVFLTVAVAQWVRLWSNDHRAVQAEGSSPAGDTYQTFFFSAMIFISVL